MNGSPLQTTPGGSGPLVEAGGSLARFEAENPRSRDLFSAAVDSLAGGLTHDVRRLEPFPIFVDAARGSRKRSVDGQELIDYWMGHGALLLGHAHPTIVAAVQQQVERGTHYGACHPLEVRWAEQIRRVVPSAERVRFTNSGTEATLLCLRLARAFTGRPGFIKLAGHFHGWHDAVAPASRPPFDGTVHPGVPEATLAHVVVVPPNDLAALEQALRSRGDIAALILEPGGGGAGTIPCGVDYLRGLRRLCDRFGAVLVFDEVISGFRVAPGGVQEWAGVTPDLTALGKILGGGLPAGAVAGKTAILGRLAYGDAAWNRESRVPHAGTYNANPLTAAAGLAMLESLSDGEHRARAHAAGDALRDGLAAVWRRRGAPGCVYGRHSTLNYSLGGSVTEAPTENSSDAAPWHAVDADLAHALRRALILNGVDMPPLHGWVSAVHSDEDVEQTVAAFDAALGLLQDDGRLP